MPFVSLTCPQCAAPLPRAAFWRTVTCTYCGVTVSRSAEVVQASAFRQVRLRVHGDVAAPTRVVRVGSNRYGLMASLGRGTASQVFLARRLHPFAGHSTLKLSCDADGAACLAREATVLAALMALRSAGSAYFSQRLPQLVATAPFHWLAGSAFDQPDPANHALVLRHPTGYWGSLADALTTHVGLPDARHAVWVWRRVLEVLAYVHDNGWSHGDIVLEHLLVHPADHGVQLIGWGAAQNAQRHHKARQDRDLMQLAWSLRRWLAGPQSAGSAAPALPSSVPQPLAELLGRSSEDSRWVSLQTAAALQQQLSQAAIASFGAPRFLAFSPT